MARINEFEYYKEKFYSLNDKKDVEAISGDGKKQSLAMCFENDND